MTCTVRAEGGIGSTSRVLHGMAIGAGGIYGTIVQADPVGVQVHIWFRSAADLDAGDKILLSGYNGNGMAQVAFQADRLLLGIQVFPIMAAETTWRVDMTKITGMRGPIDFLVIEIG